MVAVSAPTALAMRTAEAVGMTLIGVARRDGFEIFSQPERIKENRGLNIAGLKSPVLSPSQRQSATAIWQGHYTVAIGSCRQPRSRMETVGFQFVSLHRQFESAADRVVDPPNRTLASRAFS